MADLTTTYLGINLRNPIIAGSSGLTANIESIKNLERNGVGAVVLKSLFEEQVILDADNQLRQAKKNPLLYVDRSESVDYIDYHLPVIGSINCITSGEWLNFARKIEEAGADAIELNIAVLNANPNKPAISVEKLHIELTEKLKTVVNIPVTIKLSPYFCNLGQLAENLEKTGTSGLVLFNRFFSPDIDIDTLEISSGNMYSSPTEYANSLRWISILSGKTSLDLVAGTGIHDGKTIIKLLLAGAKAVQIVSTIYKNGFEVIPKIISEMEFWMEQNGYNYIDQFVGNMNQYKSKDASAYERIQFMRYYSGIGNK
jgi:dihydroorotate dehydrogenase (fumarate)